MKMPTAKDPASAPVWENYLIAQTAGASLGDIPRHAIAVGVEVHDTRAVLHFQLNELDAEDQSDIVEIVSDLEAYVGPDVTIGTACHIQNERPTSPTGRIRWVYVARGSQHP